MMSVRFDNGKRVIERWDEVFRALSVEPRRQVIVALLDAETAPLPESAINPNVPADPETLRVDLRHNHLPKLTEMEFIEWESEPFRASRGPRFDEVAVVFESLYSASTEIPDSLLIGCQRLEQERQKRAGDD